MNAALVVSIAMMTDKAKTNLATRLNRIEGQVRGVRRMIDEERYCIDVLTQTRSIVAGIRKVENLIIENHLNTCVAAAMRGGDEHDQQDKINEIITVLA